MTHFFRHSFHTPSRFTLLFASLLAACGPQGTLDGEEPLDAIEGALLTCTSNVGGGGSVGTASRNLSATTTVMSTTNIAAIQVTGPDQLTIKWFDTAGWTGVGLPAVSNVGIINLGSNIGVSGSFGDPSLMAYITSIARTSNNTITLSGNQLGADNLWRPITGSLTLANAEFDPMPVSPTYERVTSVSVYKGILSFQGTISTALKQWSVPNVRYATSCSGVTVGVTGTTGTISFTSTAPGASQVTYVIDDGPTAAFSATSPFTAPFDSKRLTNGPHTVRLIAQDTGTNRAWAGPITFTTDNDTTAPAVTVSAPVEGGGTITLTSNATDDRGISKVEYFIDNISRGSSTASPYSVAFNSALLTNGIHWLKATTTDTSGNTATSTSVSFSVYNDLQGPTNSLTIGGTRGVITIYAAASDPSGIDRVEFFLAASPPVSIGTVSASPYNLQFDTRHLPNGNKTFQAYAYDKLGNKSFAQVSRYIENITTTEVEPNNTITNPTLANVWNRNTGGLSETDVDLIRVIVPAGRTTRAATYPSTAAYLGIEMEVLDSTGTNVLYTAMTPGVSKEVLTWTNTATIATTYYVRITGQSGKGSGWYYLTVDY